MHIMDEGSFSKRSFQGNSKPLVYSNLLSETETGNNTDNYGLDLLTDHDRARINQWNKSVPEAIQECAHDPIWKQIHSIPSKIAVESWDGYFTYQELGWHSERLAHHLKILGIGPETLVPFCFEKSKWAVVAILGILKAGGAFVPLSPVYPENRLRTIIEDTAATVVVTSRDLAGTFEGIVDTVLQLPLVEPRAIGNFNLSSEVSSGNAAYVLFTSGSTGKPKGVVVEHRALRTSIEHLGTKLGFSSKIRTLHFTSYTFDPCVLEVIHTLAFGGCICVPSENQRADPETAISQLKANFASLTPTTTRTINPDLVSTLATLGIGGEAVGRQDVTQWAGKVNAINVYGPTECCIISVINHINSEHTSPNIIGQGVGCKSWIVQPDDHEMLSPVGSIGELLLQGPVLARCYLNDQEKTDKAFVYPKWIGDAEPLSKRRMYKTGDFVRYNEDGRLVYLGRKDTQVKLRGQRIEIGEIEHHISTDPRVKRSLVLLSDIRPQVPGLVAVVNLHEDSGSEVDKARLSLVNAGKEPRSESIQKVHDSLATVLPSYMMPSVWLRVSNIPLTPSEKLYRNQVKEWILEMKKGTLAMRNALVPEPSKLVAPKTPMEKKLLDVVCNVLALDISEVSILQSFAFLGGDSMTAMQTQWICRDKGIRLNYQDLIKMESIAEVARFANPEATDPQFDSREPDGSFQLSPVQEMYFAQPALPRRFHSSVYLQFLEIVEATAAEAAISKIVAKHPMLRARFKMVGGAWRQFLHRSGPQSFSFETHVIESPTDAGEVAGSIQQELDLIRGPVFAARLFEFKGSSKKTLFLLAHHLVVDQISWQIILHDLERILTGDSLPAQNSYPFWEWCDVQVRESQQISAQYVFPVMVPKANMDYWALESSSNTFADASTVGFSLSMQKTQILLQYCTRILEIEPIDMFLAAAGFSFGQIFTDRSIPAFHCEMHGRESGIREERNLSGTVGWFNTLLPLSMGEEMPVSLEEMLRVIIKTRNKIPGNGQPYFAYRFLNPEGRKAFQTHDDMEVFFNYVGSQELDHGLKLLKQEPLGIEGDARDISPDWRRLAVLDVLVGIHKGELEFTFVYNRRMKRAEEVRRWADECRQLLIPFTSGLSDR